MKTDIKPLYDRFKEYDEEITYEDNGDIKCITTHNGLQFPHDMRDIVIEWLNDLDIEINNKLLL